MSAPTDVVTAHAFQYPITEEQHEQSKYNDEVAIALVRQANTVDLQAIAEKVRR